LASRPVSARNRHVTSRQIWSCCFQTAAAARPPTPGRRQQKVLTVSCRPDLISEFLRFDLVHGDSEVQTTRLNRGVRVSDSRNSCSDRC
jgi:hypothetical protein